MSAKYVLNADGKPVVEPDLMTWGRWMENGDRHVGEETRGDVQVSTVFLGLDHNFGEGDPVLWETMIFGGEHDQYQERYTSKADALAGHARALTLAFGYAP